jgi:hypothetical protein
MTLQGESGSKQKFLGATVAYAFVKGGDMMIIWVYMFMSVSW